MERFESKSPEAVEVIRGELYKDGLEREGTRS